MPNRTGTDNPIIFRFRGVFLKILKDFLRKAMLEKGRFPSSKIGPVFPLPTRRVCEFDFHARAE